MADDAKLLNAKRKHWFWESTSSRIIVRSQHFTSSFDAIAAMTANKLVWHNSTQDGRPCSACKEW